MTTRRFTAALIGLGVAAALTGALVLSAADEGNDSQPAGPPTMRIGAVPQALPCYGSADAAQYWIIAGLASSCVQSRASTGQRPSRVRPRTCLVTANIAEHWNQATGHPPCQT